MLRLGWAESWGAGEGGRVVSGLGGVVYGEEEIFNVCVTEKGFINCAAEKARFVTTIGLSKPFGVFCG
jgi:hypothetical protein